MRASLGIITVWYLVVSAPAAAGEIYGTLRVDGKPLGGVAVEVRTEAKTYRATTDAEGGYRIYIEAPGKATFVLQYSKQTLSRDIWSYDNSARYDLVIQSQGGVYTLMRK